MNRVNKVKKVNQVKQVNKVNQVKQVKLVNQVNWVNEVKQVNQMKQVKQVNQGGKGKARGLTFSSSGNPSLLTELSAPSFLSHQLFWKLFRYLLYLFAAFINAF